MASRNGKVAALPESTIDDVDLLERRRMQVVHAATKLIARNGYANTMVRDVAKEAKVSVGSMYEYVRSKPDILFLTVDHWTRVWISGLRSAIQGSRESSERLRLCVEFLVKIADEHADVVHLFYREIGNLSTAGRQYALRAEVDLVEIVQDVVREAQAAGTVDRDIDEKVLAAHITVLAHSWALKSHLHRSTSRESYTESLLRLISTGGSGFDL